VAKDRESPLQYIKGVGPKRAAALGKLGIRTIRDLFYYFPRGYLDRSQIVRIADLRRYAAGQEPVTVFAEVFRQEARRTRRGGKLLFLLTVRDESGFLTCVWFEGFSWLKNAFEIGEFLALSAVPTFDKLHRPQFIHPQYDRLKSQEEDEPDWGKLFNTGGIIPKYRSGAELERIGLDSRGFRRIIKNAIDSHVSGFDEILPEEVIRRQNIFGLQSALRTIHFPANFQELGEARKRLKFEELFFFQLLLALRKRTARSKEQERPAVPELKNELAAGFIRSLNFELTGAQKRVIDEITRDMRSPYAMNRLLQGDVGSGKTVVAIYASLIAVENGMQAAFMAPTEILAEQHYRTLVSFLKNQPVNIRLLVGGQRKKLREDVLEDIHSGNAGIVVGTHALVEGNVKFANLGFVVIDEQHRFGVMQRSALKGKGRNPDVLVMTATPIPRTLAMTFYGDLEMSVIDEMPADRKIVRTALRTEDQKEKVYRFVRDEIGRGKQAYIVFPLIEESEKLDLKAAVKEFECLQGNIFRGENVGLLHGRMKTEEKDETMRLFKEGKIKVLVSTTVIEVGIDVPNATIMVIENAERFGLSQLHQLRGRVGRGADQSYCILIANYGWFEAGGGRGNDPTEIRREKENARVRLETMVQVNDGFKIAETDLKLRGPGEYFGTRQSGLPEFRIADLAEDADLVVDARSAAFDLVMKDPHLRSASNESVRRHFEEEYRELFRLADIG
jgi:ATP-dependent DNA helicase RecG